MAAVLPYVTVYLCESLPAGIFAENYWKLYNKEMKYLRLYLFQFFLWFGSIFGDAGINNDPSNKINDSAIVPQISVIFPDNSDQNLAQYFQCFSPLDDHGKYFIRLCGDIPDNDNPDRIHVRDEPGHVFLILEKRDHDFPEEATIKVFGFYPRRPASCLIFRNVRSQIMDNSERQYDVEVSMEISPEDFALILLRSQEFAIKKYNLNKYNCYDYALGIFNSLPGIQKLPLTHVKFPSILGKGGSPCGLYRDLQKLKKECSFWAAHIRFGIFYAPCSNPE